MKLDDIDRVLREDETIVPSGDFSARVMRAVRREAEALEAIEFPWSRLLPGLASCLLVLVAGSIVARPPEIGPAEVAVALAAATEKIPIELIATAVAPLFGSWLLVRLSLRLAGYER
jgi:hypothetical protein